MTHKKERETGVVAGQTYVLIRNAGAQWPEGATFHSEDALVERVRKLDDELDRVLVFGKYEVRLYERDLSNNDAESSSPPLGKIDVARVLFLGRVDENELVEVGRKYCLQYGRGSVDLNHLPIRFAGAPDDGVVYFCLQGLVVPEENREFAARALSAIQEEYGQPEKITVPTHSHFGEMMELQVVNEGPSEWLDGYIKVNAEDVDGFIDALACALEVIEAEMGMPYFGSEPSNRIV